MIDLFSWFLRFSNNATGSTDVSQTRVAHWFHGFCWFLLAVPGLDVLSGCSGELVEIEIEEAWQLLSRGKGGGAT